MFTAGQAPAPRHVRRWTSSASASAAGTSRRTCACPRFALTPPAAPHATVAKTSIESALAHAKNVKARKVMRSCLQLYVGAVPRLQWAARSVAAGRYSGVPDVLEAAYRDVSHGCSSLAGEVALPKENDEFFMMAFVVHAIVDRVQRIIG
uniref:Pectinesterase inhibitor domain-containing protein n=1 Tax=Triticum urartu TaxID=4572 RepID=A0A8R7K4P8_TRIUA